jgi:AAA+ ATPase superfamily predicted ATPase
MDQSNINTGFYNIFKAKLEKQKKEIDEELKKEKKDRRKRWLINQLKQTKKLQKIIKKMETILNIKTHCPNCGHKL